MRILVVSDTHGDLRTLMQAARSQPTAEVIIHCGDGEKEVEELKMTFTDKMIVAVRGNCDWASMLPLTEELKINGKKIFITHGHMYKAKLTMYNLVCAARESKADILLFGHTHNAITDYDDGLYIMNPGSCRGYGATYGFIDITDNGDIVTNIIRIK